jgi:hypothetical protein
LDKSIEKEGVVDYRYLAKTKGQSISIASTYIAFVTKMQKSKPCEKDLPILKNDITTN